MPDPADIAATAKFEQAASIENNNFDPHAGQLILELVIKPCVLRPFLNYSTSLSFYFLGAFI